MNTLMRVGQIAGGVMKVGHVIGSVTKIVVVAKKEGKLSTSEKVELVGEIVFSIVQTFDVAITGMNLFCPNKLEQISNKAGLSAYHVSLASSVTLGTLDIGKTITVKCLKDDIRIEDIMDIIAVILFRTGESIQMGSSGNIPERDKKILNYVNLGISGSGAVLSVGATGYRIYRNKDKIYKATQILLRCFSRKTDQVTVVEEYAHRNAIALEAKNNRRLSKVINWKELKKIPKFLHPNFTQYVCPITKIPIRFAQKIPGPSGTSHLCFEKGALLAWRKKYSSPPPGWPENVAYKAEKYRPIDDDVAQSKIDEKLKAWASLFKEELEAK